MDKRRWTGHFCLSMTIFMIVWILAGCGSSIRGAGHGDGKDAVSGNDVPVSQDLFAMDTYMTVTAYGSNAQTAVDRAVKEIRRLDRQLSTGDSGSEIFQVDLEGRGVLSEDGAYLVDRALGLYESTGGAFDITVYPVMDAWGFTDGAFKVPSRETLAGLLPLVDAGQIHLDRKKKEVSFGMEGMQIDLGGIAKGYTSGRIMDIFRDCGVESGLVNLGGNVQVLGAKPDGNLWRVAIQEPADVDESLGIVSVRDRTVITSGGYERYFEEDGVTYHHIIDPETGYPADSGLSSVSVISEDGTLADGLSTSFFIMGLEEASAYWRTHSREFDMILMTDSGQVYATEGIRDALSSEHEVMTITEGGGR